MPYEQFSRVIKLLLFLSIIVSIVLLFFYGLKIFNNTGKTSNIALPQNTNVTLQEDRVKSIIDYASKFLNELVSVKSQDNLYWYPVRFDFVDENNFYIEYTADKDKKNLSEILVSLDGSELDIKSYKVLAHFKPGKDMWEIVSGKDQFFDFPKIVYEYDLKRGDWFIK